jgi:hypothetical protein
MIYSKLLALCVFHLNGWGTNAFLMQGPKALTSTSIRMSEDYLSSIQQETSTALKNSNVSDMAASAASKNSNAAEMAASMANGRGSPVSSRSSVTGKTTKTADMQLSKNIWDTSSPIILQGGALRTWSESTGAVERVQVLMKTEGRPLNANVELWHGPDNTPLKMAIYSEDGGVRPFSAVIETPTGQNTIAIRNTGQMEFPLAAVVVPDVEDVASQLADMAPLKIIQGGAIQTYPFDHAVASVQVLLKTGGRPLNARIELLQGPNNDKVVIDIYTEDGMERPFFAVIETPGTGNVVRIVNTAPVEFPLTASVQPYLIEQTGRGSDEDVGRGWDNGGTSSSLSWGRQS